VDADGGGGGMMFGTGTPKLPLPVGERIEMRGLGDPAFSQPSNPLTPPSPRWEEGEEVRS
jgi:hypothetical protein